MQSRKQLLPVVIVIIAVVIASAWYFGLHNKEDQMVDLTDPLPFSFATETSTYKITVDIPATGDTELNRSVRRHIDARIKEFSETYAPANFTEKERKELGIGDRYLYEQFIEGRPWSFRDISGMHVEEYQFTGGAHGGTSVWPFIYDKEGNALSLEDLFVPGSEYLKRISDVARPRLQKELEDGGMYTADMFLPGTDPSEGNYMVFSIAETGITFYFGQYQVAPYAAGMPQVTIPLSEFQDILSPKYF